MLNLHWRAIFTDHGEHGSVEVQGPKEDDWFAFRVERPRYVSVYAATARRLGGDPFYEAAYDVTSRNCAMKGIDNFTFTRS